MKNSSTRLLYGIVLGAVGSLAIYRDDDDPTGIVTQLLATELLPVPPKIPPVKSPDEIQWR